MNKPDTPMNDITLMKQDLEDSISKQAFVHHKMMMNVFTGTIGMGTTTGNIPNNETVKVNRMVDKPKTRSRIVSYDNGYWAKVSINETDKVYYKLFNSGWLAKSLNKICSRNNHSGALGQEWSSVKQRDTVEATLGATYMAIDEAIAADMKASDHSDFLKAMIKTDPDNLKAIAQLDMLDKGDGPGTEEVNDGLTGGAKYSTNFTTVGTGTYFTKKDPKESASLVTDQMGFTEERTTTISFGGEEAIKVEPDGNVSFGDKMANAIKEVVQLDKGETDGTKQE